MLRLRKLLVTNFGPYRHEQEMLFPDDDGVTIVHGDNQRGKTYLLNAIRYALFGTVLSRGERSLPFQLIENWEEAQEGKHGFSVTLVFSHHDVGYKLTRSVRLADRVSAPKSDDDYREECFLEREGQVLSHEAAKDELARIMPETVSRFFLFDGELLQQYEALLHSGSEIGMQIKDAIERILGVPVLTNARSAANEFLAEAQQQEARAATKNQKTQVLGANHANLLARQAAHQDELQRLMDVVEGLKAQKRACEAEVEQHARVSALFEERERILKESVALGDKQKEKEQKLQETMANAWRGLIRTRLSEVTARLEERERALMAMETRRTVAAELLDAIQRQQGESSCPTCERGLSLEEKQAIVARLGEATTHRADYSKELFGVGQQLAMLRQKDKDFSVAYMNELCADIDECKQQRHRLSRRLAEIEDETKDRSEVAYRDSVRNRDTITQQLVVAEQGVEGERAALEDVIQNIEKIHRQLTKIGGADLERHSRRSEVAARLYALLDAAVGQYRERLRQRVQDDASALFRSLTSEPAYSGLLINDNYGLQIMHQDGTEIPVRSAGAEHIVALSLMGALQKNAPLRGPIIMDSPFGRLDGVHSEKVIEALPRLAPQVTLLVHGNELNLGMVRLKLGTDLRREYAIRRETAKHSVIEENHER